MYGAAAFNAEVWEAVALKLRLHEKRKAAADNTQTSNRKNGNGFRSMSMKILYSSFLQV